MTSCRQCGARASRIGIRGTVVWTRAHLGDASDNVVENTADADVDLCPTCRSADAASRHVQHGPLHALRFWRRPHAR